ncbi:MAG TPA: hypothetical protein VK053_18120 [Jiangellaceae bacterium]|nr:hypothetical protein [Jiangellaceae bacterium]
MAERHQLRQGRHPTVCQVLVSSQELGTGADGSRVVPEATSARLRRER